MCIQILAKMLEIVSSGGDSTNATQQVKYYVLYFIYFNILYTIFLRSLDAYVHCTIMFINTNTPKLSVNFYSFFISSPSLVTPKAAVVMTTVTFMVHSNI